MFGARNAACKAFCWDFVILSLREEARKYIIPIDRNPQVYYSNQ